MTPISYRDYTGFIADNGQIFDSFGDLDYLNINSMMYDLDYDYEINSDDDVDLIDVACHLV